MLNNLRDGHVLWVLFLLGCLHSGGAPRTNTKILRVFKLALNNEIVPRSIGLDTAMDLQTSP
jgi:hypothetical protein